MTILDLNNNEYLPYFKGYIDLAKGVELIYGLELGLKNTIAFYSSVPLEKLDFRYAEDKWSIKEVINHLIDAERVFCYRALRFARQDQTVLNGFDEDHYVATSNAKNRYIEDLLDEYKSVRLSTIALFKSFNDDSLMFKGKAGSGEVSVRALGFLIIGHEKHHKNVVEARYL